MGRRVRDGWSVAALVVGILSTGVGAWLIAAYVIEAVIVRIGEPDQSLLFWYLPFLMLGVVFLLVGLAAGGWGLLRRRRLAARTPDTEGARLLE